MLTELFSSNSCKNTAITEVRSMPNDYLAEIHDYLSRSLKELNLDKNKLQNEREHGLDFMEGQIQEIRQFRNFMSRQYDLASQTYY